MSVRASGGIWGDVVASPLSAEQFHSFDVTASTHDDLKDGVVAKKFHGSPNAHHRVVVSGEYSPTEASLIAAQMAYATHGYVTGVQARI